jgi:hypothetical protein
MQAHKISWRVGFLRAWVLLAVLWIIGYSIMAWPSMMSKFNLSRMSDGELLSLAYNRCVEESTPRPPEGFVLDKCLKLQKEGNVKIEQQQQWGGGESYAEQSYRVVRALVLPDLGLVVAPPLFLLLVGGSLWLGSQWV